MFTRGIYIGGSELAAVNENKKKFLEPAGDPKVAYETPVHPVIGKRKRKKETLFVRAIFFRRTSPL
jgi:hypothetical protein